MAAPNAACTAHTPAPDTIMEPPCIFSTPPVSAPTPAPSTLVGLVSSPDAETATPFRLTVPPALASAALPLGPVVVMEPLLTVMVSLLPSAKAPHPLSPLHLKGRLFAVMLATHWPVTSALTCIQ